MAAMVGRIPREFLDDLLQRIDIVDVIDARVPLKKGGRDHKACCPFHQEKTPSFTVSGDKQFYHCFGCGAHGNAIDFVMEFDRLGFVDAVEELAQLAGLEIPREESGAASGSADRTLYELLERVAERFRRALGEHPARERAVAYLKRRGVDRETAERFRIGFAPPGWDFLTATVGRDSRDRNNLLKLGLVVRNEKGREYDRFRNRILFPIRDRRGRVIAFGGRALEEDGPKYLNSPESPVFHKGRELYGLYESIQAQHRPERLLVVEGYMDVVALFQNGVPFAVATLGTATTPDHLDLLFRNTSQIVFCFDGDRAGRQAAWRALEHSLAAMRDGRRVNFLFLPEGEDPDSLIRREGREAFLKRCESAIPLSDFLFESLEHQTDIRTAEGRARFVELARPHLNRLPAGAYRQLMVRRTAESAGLAPREIERYLERPDSPLRPSLPRRPTGRTAPSPIRTAITALVQHPELIERIEPPFVWRDLPLPGMQLLVDLLELLRERPHMTTGSLLEHWRGTPEGTHLAKLASKELDLTRDEIAQELHDALAKLTEQAEAARDASDGANSPSQLSARQKELLRRELRLKALKDKERAGALSERELQELKELREGADE
ncbi:MAG: DNA primase [Gammaproteobacteria bacterium]